MNNINQTFHIFKQLFMIQEQVASFLGVRSFNYQYPQLKRRKIIGEELAYLQDKGIISLGTTDGGTDPPY